MASIESRIKALEDGRKERLSTVIVLDNDTAPLEAYKLAHHGLDPDRILTIVIVEGVMEPLPLPDRSVRRG